MSPNETEKDISLTWKDKQGEQQLCECVCVCVCEREREREREREMGQEVGWMNRQHNGAV